MFSPAELALIYQASAAGGFIFVLYCAITSQGAHSAGHVHLTHGVGHGHAGHLPGHSAGQGSGHGAAGLHGSGHSHASGHGAGHGVRHIATHAAGHAAEHGLGHDRGGDGHVGESNSQQFQGRTGQSVTGPMHLPEKLRQIDPVELLLAIVNPMRMASFLFFFGAFGRIFQLLFPALGPVTLVVAFVAGVVGSTAAIRFFGWMYTKFQSTSVSYVDDLVGHLAEVSVPISEGGIGEITYIVESKRLTSAAKSALPDGAFNRGDRVIITNLGDNALSYVEKWTEDYFDLAYDTSAKQQ